MEAKQAAQRAVGSSRLEEAQGRHPHVVVEAAHREVAVQLKTPL
jgi:hypothetical protein